MSSHTRSAVFVAAAAALTTTTIANAETVLNIARHDSVFISQDFDFVRNGDVLEYNSIAGYTLEVGGSEFSDVTPTTGQITSPSFNQSYIFGSRNPNLVTFGTLFSTASAAEALSLKSLVLSDLVNNTTQTILPDAFGQGAFNQPACDACSYDVTFNFDPAKLTENTGHFQFVLLSNPAPVPLPNPLFLLGPALALVAGRGRRAAHAASLV